MVIQAVTKCETVLFPGMRYHIGERGIRVCAVQAAEQRWRNQQARAQHTIRHIAGLKQRKNRNSFQTCVMFGQSVANDCQIENKLISSAQKRTGKL